MSDTWQLGQRVKYADELWRAYRDGHKVWLRCAEAFTYPLPGEGVLVGLRTLSDGTVDYYDDHTEYMPTKRHQAAIIATHLRRKPVLALLEDVEVLA